MCAMCDLKISRAQWRSEKKITLGSSEKKISLDLRRYMVVTDDQTGRR